MFVNMDFKKVLQAVGFQPKQGPESATAIAELERQIGVPLPADYRQFLQEVGGCDLNAWVPCTVLTPFGELHSLQVLFGVRDVVGLLDSTVAPRNMLCIGYGNNGATTCLSVAGLDHDQVFALDTTMRYYWDDEILSNLPDLAPSIREFFRQRDAHQLPERPWGYENCYHIADSFSEFVRKVRAGWTTST